MDPPEQVEDLEQPQNEPAGVLDAGYDLTALGTLQPDDVRLPSLILMSLCSPSYREYKPLSRTSC